MYLNNASIGGFTTPAYRNYWSSTEYDNHGAWSHNFLSGGQNVFDKPNTFYVRAIRSFSLPINTDTTNSVMVSTSGWNYVTVTDSLGCSATDSVYVHIDICGCLNL